MADGIYGYSPGTPGAAPGARIETYPVAAKRISWGSIFAGVAVATVSQLLFALLGLAIGLSTINPTTEQQPMAGLTIGTAIWWVISSLISLFLGGWVAGRLAGIPRRFDGVLHGVVTWAVATFLLIYFLGTAVGSLLGGALNMVRSGVSMVAQAAVAAVPDGGGGGQQAAGGAMASDSIRQEANQMLRQADKPALQPEQLRERLGDIQDAAAQAAIAAARNPQEAPRIMDSVLSSMMDEAKPVINAVDREAAVNILVARTDMTRQEAQQVVDRWIGTFRQAAGKVDTAMEQAQQQAAQTGEAIASGISQASFWSFLVILLGGFSGGLGGLFGTPRDLRSTATGGNAAATDKA